MHSQTYHLVTCLLLAAAPPAAEGYCCKLLLLLLLLLQFLLLVLPLPCYQLIVFSSDLQAELQMPSNPYDQSLRTFEKHCRARANRCKSRFRKNMEKENADLQPQPSLNV